jgi:AcrR family transcriptional regulator
MARPSRNLDRALLAAGSALFPVHGCAGLTIRQVADVAGVNIGMFHYHFGSREAFLRALLQQTYEGMFADLRLETGRQLEPVAALRSAFRVIGRFARENRGFIVRVMADALSGEVVARDFMRENLPRHLGLIQALLAEGQRRGAIRAMAPRQALAFCVGAIGSPILLGGAIADSGALPRTASRALADDVLSAEAIDERIELALAALATARPARRATARTASRTTQ